MLKNYLKVAWRNLVNKKYYSFLNLLGLSIGITAGMLIMVYVQDELSYDTFHPDAEHKYVMGLDGKVGGQELLGIFTPPPLADAVVEEVGGVVSATRTTQAGNIVFRYGERSFTEEKVFWADSNFYDFFGYDLLQGDPATALKGPNKAVISRSTARKYFGSENPVGKMLVVGNNQANYEVTGVNADTPHNSHFRFDILLSFSTTQQSSSGEWLANSLNTYIQLDPDTPMSEVEDDFEELIVKYVGPQIENFTGATLEQMGEMGGRYGYFTVPILDLHLEAAHIQTNFEPAGDITYVYIFSAIGVFLIIIASVNFMNLATASASGRAREVGLRKTLGSNRGSMIGQFLIESILHVILAALISILLIWLILPWFNQLAGKELTLHIFTEPWFIAGTGGLLLFVGLLAGSYPAFYLTSFHPVEVLKGKVGRGAKSGGFRRTLVVVQFFISIGLITCTLLVHQQLQFMQDKNLGVNRDHALVLSNTSRLDNNLNAFHRELNADPRVAAASYNSNTVPGATNITLFKRPERTEDFMMAVYFADYEQQKALGFEMAEGRYFNPEIPTDTTGMILNESAVAELGLDEPIGKEIIFPGMNNTLFPVIGVVKNFNFESLRNEIMPLAIVFTESANEMLVRFNTEDPQESVAIVEAAWEKFAGSEPLDYAFLNEDFDLLFRQEMRMGSVFTVFTVIAIIIACLGLLGLSAFMAERRTQEIGIRKVLGASTSSIIGLLSTEFLKLIGIAFLLASPLAWYFMHRWLEDYAYRIEIGPMTFIVTAAAILVVVMITISFQTLKAAHKNPVESIHTD